MTAYIDTSAVVKLVVAEPESAALREYVDELPESEALVSSALLETELRRYAARHGLSQVDISTVLDMLDLLETDRSIFTEAGLLPGSNLRSLDALHIASAIRAEADVLITYDIRMTDAARTVGLQVVAPE